jgi:hypothetical protein
MVKNDNENNKQDGTNLAVEFDVRDCKMAAFYNPPGQILRPNLYRKWHRHERAIRQERRPSQKYEGENARWIQIMSVSYVGRNLGTLRFA